MQPLGRGSLAPFRGCASFGAPSLRAQEHAAREGRGADVRGAASLRVREFLAELSSGCLRMAGARLAPRAAKWALPFDSFRAFAKACAVRKKSTAHENEGRGFRSAYEAFLCLPSRSFAPARVCGLREGGGFRETCGCNGRGARRSSPFPVALPLLRPPPSNSPFATCFVLDPIQETVEPFRRDFP